MKNELSYLPRLYPNELLYSLFARFHRHCLNTSPKRTALELFGNKFQLAVYDLPTNLNNFHSRGGKFIEKNIDELIEQHTLYHYYSNFLHKKDRRFIKDTMLQGNVKSVIHIKSGVVASSIKSLSEFRYCPECVKMDISKYGETYWRVNHQLFGVFVCTKHKLYLENSNVKLNGENRYDYIAASTTNCNLDKIRPTKNFETDIILINLARDCELLASNNFDLRISDLTEAYKEHLKRLGYIKGKNTVDQYSLAKDFKEFYGKDLLNKFQSNVHYLDSSCWLKAITRKHRKSFHPIRHLLLINFIGVPLREIIENRVSPFGIGPFPCLNKYSYHYLENTINSISIVNSPINRAPIGIFQCSCGFKYSRKGPDQKESDKYKYHRVNEYGENWVEGIRELIFVKGYSYRKVARLSGVDPKTVIKYSKINEKVNETKKEISKDITSKKEQWEDLIKSNNGKTISKLRHLQPTLYAWLYRNEKEWLLDISPKKVKDSNNINKRVNWNNRDVQIAAEVMKAVHSITLMEPPKRITVSRLGTLINRKSLLEKQLDKLPYTRNVLKNNVETIASFQIRRINYVLANILRQNGEIKGWRLRRLAGLGEVLQDDVEAYLKKIIGESRC